MTTSWRRDLSVAELEEPPGPWRNPVPFLWLLIVMLLSGAVAALLTGAAEPPEDGEARARIVADADADADAGSVTAGDFEPKRLHPPPSTAPPAS